MESNVLAGIGASMTLHDRMFTASDAAVEDFCDDCGSFAHGTRQCIACGSINISQANLPIAGRLMYQQFNAMGIDTTFEAAYG
jgi:DNA-directed RNA polymerase beta subunit